MGGTSSSYCRQARGFTIIELLTVVAIILLLAAITAPWLSFARARARDMRCATNLHSVGQAIHSLVNAHDDYAAPCIRERDYYWDRGKQIGWDIQTGRWAYIPGGPGTFWQCPMGETSYVGKAYGVLFADGHAAVGRYRRECDGVLWPGRRWWK